MKSEPATADSTGVYAAATLVGFGLWLMASVIADRKEAWDSGLYWIVFYPLSIIACWYFGLRHPDRPWRWALALFFGQCLALGIRSGELGNLFPLGLILFGVLALPGIAVAKRAARRSVRA